MSDRITPFSNGTEYEAWCIVNCDRCAKYSKHTTNCEIALDLIGGYLGDGTVPAETGRRMGFVGGEHTGVCTELEVPHE